MSYFSDISQLNKLNQHNPTLLPISSLVSGDTIKFTINAMDVFEGLYTSGAGYSLKYVLKIVNSPAITFTSTSNINTEDFDILVTSATTSTWVAGVYNVQVFIMDLTERIKILDTTLLIEQDLATSTLSSDPRTDNKKAYDCICAVLNNQMDGISELTISGRMIKKMPISDLLKLRAYYKKLVDKENGSGGLKIIRFNFSR